MYEDTPQELVHDLFSQAVFGDHPLGRPVIGTAEVISTVSRRALSGYHRTAYAPGNVVVAAAGNLEHDRLVALLQRSERRAGAPARAGTRVRRPLARLPAPELRFQRKDTEQYHVCLGATGISRSDRRRFAASLLDSILGGSASSRLFQEIREKRGMAYSVYSFAAQYTDTGVIGVYVGTREENLGACVEICRRADRRDRRGTAAQGRARAREGEPQGPHRPLARVDVEPHEPAREVARHRHRAHDARARHGRDRRGRRRTSSPSSPRCCCRRSGSRRRASGRTRTSSAPRSGAPAPRSWKAPPREDRVLRRGREDRLGRRGASRRRRSRGPRDRGRR